MKANSYILKLTTTSFSYFLQAHREGVRQVCLPPPPQPPSYKTFLHKHWERSEKRILLVFTLKCEMHKKKLTRYSTKQTCPSSFIIMYCNERNPLPSILIEILLEKCRALVDGFRRLILYLSTETQLVFSSSRTWPFKPLLRMQIPFSMFWIPVPMINFVYNIPVCLCLLTLKWLHHVWVLWKIWL